LSKIKKTYKTLFILLLILASIPATAYVILQSNRVQTMLVSLFANEISDNLKAKINIESAKISFFNRIRLDNLYIEDQKRDTLLFAEKTYINLRRIDKKNRIVVISKMNFENADIHFDIDSTRTINFQFIIDELKKNKKKKQNKQKLRLKFGTINFSNATFQLTNYHKKNATSGINFSDLSIHKMDLRVDDLKVHGDTADMKIKDLVVREKSGFVNKSFSAHLNICKTHMIFDRVNIATKASTIKSQRVAMRFDDFKSFSNAGLYENVDFDIRLKHSIININDLAYFAPSLANINQVTAVKGNIYGKLSNLKGKNVELDYGVSTNIKGDFNINGLPGIEDAFMYIDIDRCITQHADMESFALPLANNMDGLPENLKFLGLIQFSGNFTGFVDDFVTYGEFTTDLGNFSTDLLFKPMRKGVISYNGNLKSQNFELGALLSDKNDLIGKITLDAQVDGTLEEKHSILANMEGRINSIEVNQYDYQNIKLSGELKDNSFDGALFVDDPNCELEFNGKISFNEQLADFNFVANVTQANLYKLNIDKTDPSSFASFLLEAKGTGRNLDEFNGEIKLLNSFFSKRDKQVQLYDFQLLANNTLDTSKIRLRSDFLDADIEGKYEFKYIHNSLKHYINKFVPSLFSEYKYFDHSIQNDFTVEGEFKNTKSVTNFFLPNFEIAENTHFTAMYDPHNASMRFHLESPELAYNAFSWRNIFIDAFSQDSLFSLESGSKYFSMNDNVQLENYSVYLDVLSDSINFLSRWHNWDTVLFKGSIEANGKFKNNRALEGTQLALDIPSSQIVMGDSIWDLHSCAMYIDSSGIMVDSFKIQRENQVFLIAGNISKKPDDLLSMNFSDFKLTNFNVITQNRNIHLDGILDGESTISNVFQNLTFTTDLQIDDFQLNNELIGKTYLKSAYNTSKKIIDVHAFSTRGSLKTLEIQGDYHPETHGLDFSLNMNKLKINILNPYAVDIASEINGIASGKVALTGTLSRPLFNGTVDFNRTSFKIDYLNTHYSFSDEVKIVNNNVLLDEIQIFDTRGNSAMARGVISNNYLKDVHLNLIFNAESFLFLNTDYTHNQDFYGNAYATGQVRLTGSAQDLTFDIQAKTNKNTRFFIPLNTDEEVASYDFVRFVNKTVEDEQETEQQIQTQRNISGLKLNFDLEITPDAEVQLIFDSQVGDIIRGRGYGAIKLEINTAGKFNMFGDYTITEGDYLFTLQNIINKKFVVDEGSYISWNGDPMDANININAIYTTKAKLSNLFSPDEIAVNQERSDFYSSRIPVECQIHMTKRLVNPDLAFDIHLPTADPETRTHVANSINTEEELSKQFLSLLVINSFMIDPNQIGGSQNYQTAYSAPGAIGVTTSELFSNQLSHWLSQMSNEVDIGINYRPGDAITSKEVEVALSTKILNDRVSINGNLDMGGKTERVTNQTSNIVGDFDVDVKINENGKLHVKAFNKANDNLSYYNSDYTQGVGIFFREEFDSLEELLSRYLKKLNGKTSETDNKDDS
jgi:hypothetical protein